MATLMQIDGGGQLSPMLAEPYGTEAELQALLARHPDLLSADDDGGRRWLLIRREMSVPIQGSDLSGGDATGYIDHLFVDQDGVPTIVEVKRAINTEARRQVAGQILDYAANAPLHWSGGLLRQAFEAPLEAKGQEPGDALSSFLGIEDADPDAFWDQVETNLREGRLRLVFVMDIVPPSLQRIVEFLNRQMASVEVMAVEIRRHIGSSGNVLEVQRKGETASRRRNPASARRERPSLEVWRNGFLGHHGNEVAAGIDAIIAFMSERGETFATAAQSPSLGMRLLNVSRAPYPLFVKWNGSITISLSYLMRNDALTDAAVRAQWAEHLMACAPGRSRFGAPNGDVVFAPEVLREPATVRDILGVVEELIAVLKP